MAVFLKVFATALMLVAAEASAEPQANLLQRAIDRGRTMYLYDRSAWLTSDDATAQLGGRQAEIGGWIVTQSGATLHVDYFGKEGSAERIVYAADVIGATITNRTVYPASAEPVMKDPALSMVRALRAARTEVSRHAEWRPCTTAPFNTVVLPPRADGTIPVYFLTPQTEITSFPFGGHYEVDISKDGKTTFARSFTRSCLAIAKMPDPNGAVPAALFVTHLLDPQPTEIHVFEQYYIGIPVIVGTGPKSVWKVQDGTIQDISAMMRR